MRSFNLPGRGTRGVNAATSQTILMVRKVLLTMMRRGYWINHVWCIRAAGDKGVTRTPVEALWQPIRYPRNALYRFPVRFRSIEALPDLLSYVNSQAVTPGCRLVCNGCRNGRVAINLPDLMAYITSQVVSPGYRLVSNGGGRDVYYNKLYNPVYHIIPNH